MFTAEQEAKIEVHRQHAELEHLASMQSAVGASAADMVQLIVARENGPPARLIQVLGDCQPLYKRWADCVAENGGTGAKECVTALKEFRACHKKSTDLALSSALKQ